MNRIAPVTKLFSIAAIAVGVGAVAAPTLETTNYESPKVGMDIGLTIGTPGVLNLGVTKWGVGPVPLLLRASGGYFGENVWGYQGEAGWAFDTEGSFRQYLAFAYTRSEINIPSRGRGLSWEGMGPMYGINWGGFSAQLGLSFGNGTSTDGLVVSKVSSPQLMAQIGYAYYF